VGRTADTPATDGVDMDAAGFVAYARSCAGQWDSDGNLPSGVIATMGTTGMFGVNLPAAWGGAGGTSRQLGELSAQLGGVCTAARGLLTVQDMVAAVLLRWGTAEQRHRWLPALARGERIAGFAATEPNAGTDLAAAETEVAREGDDLTVRGRKSWVTFGELADVFLVLGTDTGRPVTVLVEADRPGVTRVPVRNPLGMRAAHLADVIFDSVRVPAENQVAPAGFGLSHVVGTALDHGRFTVAWGCVGMAGACLDRAVDHANTRIQGTVRLAQHQLVRALVGRCLVRVTAARQLCERAALLRQERRPEAIAETVVAKYTAARAAASVSRDAVQLLGAAGCAPDSLVARFFRDAKVMQIIEGPDEVAELRIGEYALRRTGRSKES
jgi:methoxymalonate biosynthesis protein